MCVPSPFPVDLDTNSLDCDYSAPLPDASGPRERAHAGNAGERRVRNVHTAFDFSNPTVNQVDESVTVTDSMGGTLGTVTAAEGSKTFTYTKTIGPYTAAECGSKTVDNTATYTTVDSAATGSASAAVAVTVTCPPPPPPKCALPSLVWKLVGLLGPHYFATLLPQTLGTAGGPKTRQRHLDAPGHVDPVQGVDLDERRRPPLDGAARGEAERGLRPRRLLDRGDDGRSRRVPGDAQRVELLSTLEKNQVKAWTVTLEAYNNQCIPDIGHGDHDWCKKHWDKPDHDWHKWNWKKFDWDD